jgi:aquaporin Z
MKKYLAEGIGTFFLMLTMVMTANNGTGTLSPLAIGLALTGLTYAGWHISTAHYNPAVTLAVLICGRIDRTDALYYVVAQIAGAVVAALFGAFLLNCSGATSIPTLLNKNGLCALIAEFLGAFALAYVLLNVAFTNRNEGNSYYGLAIGFTLTGAIWTLTGISGGAFNPALALGATIAGMFDGADYWIYLIGALLGAAAAASAFQVVYGRQE